MGSQSSVLAPEQGYLFLGGFWILMGIFILKFFPHARSILGFLVANRMVGLLLAIFTLTVVWMWGIAFLVPSQKGYEDGLAGVSWATVPNAAALFLMAFIAPRMREVYKDGMTLPQYMGKRFGLRMEILYTLAIIAVQGGYALVINITGANLLVNLVTGIPKETLVIIFPLMMVTLSCLKGIFSSLGLDTIKMAMVAFVVLLIIPWSVWQAGGVPAITGGLGGIKGDTSLFDPGVALTFGIPYMITLFSGATVDQQLWQRAFSIQERFVRKAFMCAGVIFGFVVFSIGILGFVAASPSSQVVVSNNQVAGFAVVVQYLPVEAVVVFMFMVLAGLVAAGASALNAASSMVNVDVWQVLRPNSSDRSRIWVSQISMWVFAVIGIWLVSVNFTLLQWILLVGTFRGALFFPTIFSLYWKRLTGTVTMWGILLSMVMGVGLFLRAEAVFGPNTPLIASVTALSISLIACLIDRLMSSREFNFATISQERSRT